MTIPQTAHSWQNDYHGWNRFYAWGRTKLLQQRLRTLLPFIPHQGRLIDIGCGIGVVAQLIAEERPELTILGVDPNTQRIHAARKANKETGRISFAVGTAATVTFASDDIVLFLDVLHHLPYRDHASFLTHLRHQTGDHGRLLIDDVTTAPMLKYWCAYVIDTLLYPFSTRCQFYSTNAMHTLLANAGWQRKASLDTSSGSPLPTHLYVADGSTS